MTIMIRAEKQRIANNVYDMTLGTGQDFDEHPTVEQISQYCKRYGNLTLDQNVEFLNQWRDCWHAKEQP